MVIYSVLAGILAAILKTHFLKVRFFETCCTHSWCPIGFKTVEKPFVVFLGAKLYIPSPTMNKLSDEIERKCVSAAADTADS